MIQRTPLELLDQMLGELKALPDPNPDTKRKLHDKYRLEWNFHSNHIEGNTLTYGQTQLLLFRGKAIGDHEKQEYDEIEAHDLAIELVKEWASEPVRALTEADLRQLNEILLVRPFWKEAITSDGQPTRKKIIPGTYKTSPNSVRLRSGQIHHYASPEETPALMGELMEKAKKLVDIHPVEHAAFLHHQLTKIHPFDDGNGRVARLWANFVLLKAGFTPLIIRSENKNKYLTVLEQADAGDLSPLVDYLAEELQWSVGLAIKAAKGEPLEEKGDLEKELTVFKRKYERNEKPIIKSPEVIVRVYEESMRPFLQKLHAKMSEFDDLFSSTSTSVLVDGKFLKNANNPASDHFGFSDKYIKDIKVAVSLVSKQGGSLKSYNANSITYRREWKGFIRNGPHLFNVLFQIDFELDEASYRIHSKSNLKLYNKTFLYDSIFSEDEQNKAIVSYMRYIMEVIDSRINK